jgi:hypothetical protein
LGLVLGWRDFGFGLEGSQAAHSLRLMHEHIIRFSFCLCWSLVLGRFNLLLFVSPIVLRVARPETRAGRGLWRVVGRLSWKR